MNRFSHRKKGADLWLRAWVYIGSTFRLALCLVTQALCICVCAPVQTLWSLRQLRMAVYHMPTENVRHPYSHPSLCPPI
jgi:hypothetical protein